MDSYVSHRKKCHKNKSHAFSALRQLGLTESVEDHEARKKEVAFHEKLDKDFKAGKF